MLCKQGFRANADSMTENPSDTALVAAPPADIVVADAEGDTFPASELNLLPYVKLDVVGGETIVTNLLTHEQMCAPGVWKFKESDPDALVLVPAEDESVPAREIAVAREFEIVAFTDDETGDIVLQDGSGAASLDKVASAYTLARIDIAFNDTAAAVSLNASVFKRDRAGQQTVCWDLHDFYKYMKLGTYGGQPSAWIGHSVDRWEMFLSKHVGAGHVVFGKYVSDNTDRRANLPVRERCLQSTSASTLGFLVLSSWANIGRADGLDRAFRTLTSTLPFTSRTAISISQSCKS